MTHRGAAKTGPFFLHEIPHEGSGEAEGPFCNIFQESQTRFGVTELDSTIVPAALVVES